MLRQTLTLKRLWPLLFLPAGLILTVIAGNSTSFAEGYARTVYPVLSRAGNFLTSLFPISLAEYLVLILLPGVPLYLGVCIVRLVRNREQRGTRALRYVINPLCLACTVYFAFVVFCGINYHRLSFAEVSGLDVRASTVKELKGLCTELAQEATALREQMPENADGVMTSGFPDIYAAGREARSCYDGLARQYPTLTAGYQTPKPVLFSRFLSYCNITGIFVPFTMESNINADVPDYSIPATMCHELSHLRGYMREDEANFLGYLACRQSGCAEFRYSGVMLAYVHATNALYGADQEAYQEVSSLLSDGVRRDFAAGSAYWKQFETPIAQVASQVNDTYLKANNQQDGVKSYGRMVDLLLADYRQRHGLTL